MKEIKTETNCYDCINFIISWDKYAPYACNKFSFKSKKLPSIIVEEASKTKCQFFKNKQVIKKESQI